MKPARFEYVAARSVEEAVAARAAHDDTVVLAGGQSLIPMLNYRVAQPDAVIDINRVPGLGGISVADGAVRVGAMVRHRQLELSDEAFAANPLLREVMGNVAHIPIRNRGTICGSLAHADAAAELPAALVCLGGSVTVQGTGGQRTVAASDLFMFHMTTTLQPDEIITEALFPALPDGAGYAFVEMTRRHGDYAVAGICAVITPDAGGGCAAASISACGIAEKPVRLPDVEAALVGTDLSEAAVRAAAAHVDGAVTNEDDGAGGRYRRKVARTLIVRAVATAVSRAAGNAGQGRA
ncbi:FAD binding domain-containing protein [Microbaculum marinum]|uniref:FAD binding domain-containing protein n=1 Tax=Microbaculum marinum TaxID=1764581 RepID=A0AAW9S0I6_9HYPH